MRLASLAVYVADGDFANGRSIGGGQGGNEAVQLTVERYFLHYLAAIRLEGRPEIVQFHPAQLGHKPVGDAGRNPPHDKVINALFAPAADDVVSLAQLLQEHGNVVGIVLQVAIHGDDVLTFGVIEAGRKRRGLPEVAAQFYHYDAPIDRGDLLQHPEGIVVAAVVHEDQLERLVGAFHHHLEAVIELGYILFFVVEGDDNGVLEHG